MNMVARVKETGSRVMGLAAMIGMIAVAAGLIVGAATFSLLVMKWTIPAFMITFLVSLVVLGPLAFIPPARGVSAIGFMTASFAFGVILWIWGMAYTYSVWGLLGVIVGLVFLGVGVVPVAMVAALVHGDWGNLGIFLLGAVLTSGCRSLANWLAQKADERLAHLNDFSAAGSGYEIEGFAVERSVDGRP